MTKLKWGESGFGINVIATGKTDHEFKPDINITKRFLQNMMENSHHFLFINEIIHYWYLRICQGYSHFTCLLSCYLSIKKIWDGVNNDVASCYYITRLNIFMTSEHRLLSCWLNWQASSCSSSISKYCWSFGWVLYEGQLVSL